jgi:hypothetical protein
LSSTLLAAAGPVAAALCACVAATPPRPTARPPAAAPAAADADYDWRALVPAPFGTLLKDLPVALTEVWQFHDAAQSGRGTEERECYTPQDSTPRSLLGQRVEDYLLCFDHDRLDRVEAAVHVPEASAARRFAAACAEWRRRAGVTLGADAADERATGAGAGGKEEGGASAVGQGVVGAGATGQGEVGAGAAGQGEVGAGAVGQGVVGAGAAGAGAAGQSEKGPSAAGEDPAGAAGAAASGRPAAAPIPAAGTPDRCEGRDGATEFSAHLIRAPESARAGDLAGSAGAAVSAPMATVSLSLTASAP